MNLYFDSHILSKESGFLIVPLTQEQAGAHKEKPFHLEGSSIQVELHDFSGEAGAATLVYPLEGPCTRVFAVGLGAEKDVDAERVRRAFDAGVKKARELKQSTISCALPDLNSKAISMEDSLKAAGEGVYLGNYLFTKYKRAGKDRYVGVGQAYFGFLDANRKLSVHALETVLHETGIVCENVCRARDWVNENADVANSLFFEKQARGLAQKNKLRCTVFNEKQLKRMGFHMILAVAKAAQVPPRLIILEYKGNPKSSKRMAFVGKGITFDSGGLNLKVASPATPPGFGIEAMKSDMAGAASCVCALNALAELKAKVNAVAVIPVCENIIDAKSYKPGDVIDSFARKTVEIGNTDAEGRLVLGDALAYTVAHLKPSLIVDLATLTGSCVNTFGPWVSGLASNDSFYARQVFESGQRTFERVWELPLYQEYADDIKSDYADLKNLGNSKLAGMLTASAFLGAFVGDTSWVHVDIAGPAFLQTPQAYIPKGGTGVGVRLLVDFAVHAAWK